MVVQHTLIALVLSTFQKKPKKLMTAKIVSEISSGCRSLNWYCVDTFAIGLLILCSKAKAWQTLQTCASTQFWEKWKSISEFFFKIKYKHEWIRWVWYQINFSSN